MRLYAYVIPYDNGFSPNPAHGYCTLACCKPRIRESVGRYVIDSFEEELDEDGMESWNKNGFKEFFEESSDLSRSIRERLIDRGAWDETAKACEKIKAGLRKKHNLRQVRIKKFGMRSAMPLTKRIISEMVGR